MAAETDVRNARLTLTGAPLDLQPCSALPPRPWFRLCETGSPVVTGTQEFQMFDRTKLTSGGFSPSRSEREQVEEGGKGRKPGGSEQDVENGYHQLVPDTCHDVLATTRRQNTALDSAYGKTTPTSATTTSKGAAFPKEAGDPERGTGPDGPLPTGGHGSPDSEPISVEMEGKGEGRPVLSESQSQTPHRPPLTSLTTNTITTHQCFTLAEQSPDVSMHA
ncbi:hypothetical protein D4764_10G0007860 [Takifugu flavidus]|uniref:Uncharacterized protein n=1 Tax=Takifugu flavidus TaxID=433684 RepID=A0A5C6PLH0_9TELE|nr:hypothetical protein D4764_10G0007860 [Takifugu flavidus]